MCLGSVRRIGRGMADSKTDYVLIVNRPLLGMPEAAALCGLTEKTIRQAVRRGDLIACYAYTPTVRIRRRGFG